MITDPLELFGAYPQHFDPEFVLKWPEIVHIYFAIEELAGTVEYREDYGIDLFVAKIRWDTMLREGGDGGYKVSNNNTACFARLYFFRHPARPLFRMNSTKHERRNGVQPPDEMEYDL